MDSQQVLARFNRQIRQRPVPDHPQQRVESDGSVIRVVSHHDAGWAGVTWSDLSEATADAVIAAQISRFAASCQDWEWKYYSYDRPSDLPERLLAAGFTSQPEESLLVAETAALAIDASPPEGIVLVPVIDAGGVAALVSVHDQVFGGDHSDVGRYLRSRLTQHPDGVAAVVAWAGQEPVAAGRVEFHQGSEFASLWGGGTLPGFRSRGVYHSLVAHRAAEAASRGFRYLQVDASAESRPILQRLGFVELATTTPFLRPGGPSASPGALNRYRNEARVVSPRAPD